MKVYVIGGDGTQKGANAIYEVILNFLVKFYFSNFPWKRILKSIRFTQLQEARKRGLKVAIAGIPKTIDNDIAVSQGLRSISSTLSTPFQALVFKCFFRTLGFSTILQLVRFFVNSGD